MPELPEVETTVRGLNRTVVGKHIQDVWTSYRSTFHAGKESVKDPAYFRRFVRTVVGAQILRARRRAKFVLIDLSNGHTIVTHMKMTGHFLFGRYARKGATWFPAESGPLNDPMNRFVRIVFSFTDGTHLAFSDLRKFATVRVLPTVALADTKDLATLGPEPLDRSFTATHFRAALARRSKRSIKPTLVDQTIIAGIGNIYADEALWRASIHPLSLVGAIPPTRLTLLYRAVRTVLTEALAIGGDSDSDYRTIDGTHGGFQNFHKAYRRTGARCEKRGCTGTISRIVIGARSAHFCDTHQARF